MLKKYFFKSIFLALGALLFPCACVFGSIQKPLLFVAKSNDKFGYINQSGKVVIPFEFERAFDFNEGLALVEVNKKYGFINENGNFVINPKYDYASNFSEGFAIAKLNKNYCYINKYGNCVIELKVGSVPSLFSEGLAGISVDKKLGFIDKKGVWIIKPQFKSGQGYTSSFHENRAVVGKFINNSFSDAKWGFIDKKGSWSVEPKYDDVLPFSEGLAGVKVNGKWGAIDKDGSFIIKPQFHQEVNFKEGLSVVNINGNWVFIDKTGRIALVPKVKGIPNSFSEGLCSILMKSDALVPYGFKELFGYINKNGDLVIDPLFTNADDFKNGLASVQVISSWGYINRKGKIVFLKINKKTWNI